MYVHPSALCESDEIGDGTRVWAFAHVVQGARIGRNCNIGDHAFVESGVILGDNVTVKNGVAIWEGVTAGNDVFIGPNAVFTNDLMPRAAVKLPTEQWLVRTLLEDGATIPAPTPPVSTASRQVAHGTRHEQLRGARCRVGLAALPDKSCLTV